MLNLTTYCAIIGAQRAGTTMLYHILNQHPDICFALPNIPEPKYFINSINESEKDYLNAHFQHRNQENCLIEKSTSYYECPDSISKFMRFEKNIRFIAILRNPVDRAISNYYFTKKHGLENRSLEDVFIHEKPAPPLLKKISVNPFNYLERGKYLMLFEPFWKAMGMENIHFIQYEKLIINPDILLKTCDFLQISHHNFKLLDNKVNDTQKTEISSEVRNVIQAYYLDHNKSLGEFIDIDISKWQVN